MPPSASCPVLEVDKQLSKYIHSQPQTRRIRSSLLKFLTLQITSASLQPSSHHVDYECPLGHPVVNRKSEELNGIRLRYLRAVESHSEARLKHRKLQESTDGQRTQQLLATASQSQSNYDHDVIRGYVSLLRQRQRLVELQAISGGIERLLSVTPVGSQHDVKAMVKHSVGEQPGLPAEQSVNMSHRSEDDGHVFRLKKEVLDARLQMDRTISVRGTTHETQRPRPSLGQKVYALGRARDEIQEWLEEELAKLAEESELLDDASPSRRLPDGATEPDSASLRSSIRTSYNQYITSRKGLVGSHRFAHQVSEPLALSLTRSQLHDPSDKAPRSTTLAASGIAYHPGLAQISRNEQALLEQAVHLQTRIAAADEEICGTLVRLSQESHLLASGSKEPGGWGRIVQEAERNAGDMVEAQLKESVWKADAVRDIVDICSLHGKVLTSMTRSW